MSQETWVPSAPVPIPSDPFTQIVDDLWQGGSRQARPTSEQFDAVLTLWEGASNPDDGVRHKRWHIRDAGLPNLDELDAVVGWVHRRWMEGLSVLVRCEAGLNRSGLVVARVLIDAGAQPEEAIALIQRRRSPYALCNTVFSDYLLGLA